MTSDKPLLHHKAAFVTALKNYEPSAETKALLRETPLVIMLGVSGGGRNTIINHLVNDGHYHFIVSDTTRPPKIRDGRREEHGVHYNFRKEEDVLADIQAGQFLEAELIHNQQVSGINSAELVRAHRSGKIPINEVDLGGTVAIRNAKPDTLFFFVIPPSFKDWMYRLKGREVMSDEELKNRMLTARDVLRAGLADNGFIFIINDSSHHSAQTIDEAVRQQKINHVEDENGREAAREILKQVEEFIGTH